MNLRGSGLGKQEIDLSERSTRVGQGMKCMVYV